MTEHPGSARPAAEVNRLELLAEELSRSSEFRVLRRISRRSRYNADTATDKINGIYLDVETTGLDCGKDDVIELALLPFEFDRQGRIYALKESFASYCEPAAPISSEVTRLTGITNEMVAGTRIDPEKIEKIISDASIVIAHNAAFDRPFVEKKWPAFEKKAWGCSMSQVNWKGENLGSAKLEALVMHFGFFYNAHRALDDCYAGMELLSQQLPVSGRLVLDQLLECARRPSYVIWATSSPYSSREVLKNRGYRWHDGRFGLPKAWYIDVSDDMVDAEIQFLKDFIYVADWQPRIVRITPFNRFSSRIW